MRQHLRLCPTSYGWLQCTMYSLRRALSAVQPAISLSHGRLLRLSFLAGLRLQASTRLSSTIQSGLRQDLRLILTLRSLLLRTILTSRQLLVRTLLTRCSRHSLLHIQVITVTTLCTGSQTLMTGMVSAAAHLVQAQVSSHSSIHSREVRKSLASRQFLSLV